MSLLTSVVRGEVRVAGQQQGHEAGQLGVIRALIPTSGLTLEEVGCCEVGDSLSLLATGDRLCLSGEGE